jgi:hypothetical protein
MQVSVTADYYDVRLKRARLSRLVQHEQSTFSQLDILYRASMRGLFGSFHFDAIALPRSARTCGMQAAPNQRYRSEVSQNSRRTSASTARPR